ncbi:MAG: hypothetical protein ACLFO2_02315 [Candidatus Woesearchaeota archaeon]
MAQFDEPKGRISILVGILVTALGLVPLLNTWGFIGFNWPEVVLNLIPGIAIWAIPALALFLFADAVDEDDTIRAVTVILGLVFLVFGAVQILNKFGVIGFGLDLGDTAYQIAFAVEGLFLTIATFAMD